MSVQFTSEYVPLPTGESLHLGHWCSAQSGPPVLMIHGAIENGRIFYSPSGKGLAPYLAAQGYDVYVADLRGRGLSTPRISRNSRFGQTEQILVDIPALSDYLVQQCGTVPQHWIAHSWGGVMIMSVLARFPHLCQRLQNLVFFGTKRCIRVQNRDKFRNIDLFWNSNALWLSQLWGYLPARQLKFGSDNESRLSHAESVAWVRPSRWRDPRDGFRYDRALPREKLPPVLYIAAIADTYLGHPTDVQAFMTEVEAPHSHYWLLSRPRNSHDYGHIDMLTHPNAIEDHFPAVRDWMALPKPNGLSL